MSSISETLLNELNLLTGSVALSIKDLKSGDTFHYNQDFQFWAASTIKVPIALTFFSKQANDFPDLNKKIQIEEDNFVLGSGIVKLLDHINYYSFKDLITFIFTVSDNTATNQLIDYVGWQEIDKFMQSIGMINSTLKHKMMIAAGRGPNLTTSRDMLHILEMMYFNKLKGSEVILEAMCEQIDRTRIPRYIPNSIKIAHKFGTLPKAVHEVGIVYSKNPFIFCFFSDEQQNKELTTNILSKCAKLYYEYTLTL